MKVIQHPWFEKDTGRGGGARRKQAITPMSTLGCSGTSVATRNRRCGWLCLERNVRGRPSCWSRPGES